MVRSTGNGPGIRWRYTQAMTEKPREPEKPEVTPGYGVDRSQIRRLLELTPEERLALFVDSARNVAELVATARVV